MSVSNISTDVEKDAAGLGYASLTNEAVQSFTWENITVTVKDRKTKQPLNLLSSVSGIVEAGEIMALMGPRYVPEAYTSTNGADHPSVARERQHSSISLLIGLLCRMQAYKRPFASMVHPLLCPRSAS